MRWNNVFLKYEKVNCYSFKKLNLIKIKFFFWLLFSRIATSLKIFFKNGGKKIANRKKKTENRKQNKNCLCLCAFVCVKTDKY